MIAVILAGGLGTRLSEETDLKPKPMVEIGGKPILWHIMKIFSSHGVNDFLICCGYKGYMIKEYFANYFLHQSDVTFNMSDNSVQMHQNSVEPWRVTLVDTGEQTMTGGRLKRVQDFLKDEEQFCLSYGDGVSDVDITRLIQFHYDHGKKVTVTATRPPGRYGALQLGDRDTVHRFQEKPSDDGNWISGGFFVLSPEVLDLIEDDKTTWEHGPLSQLANEGELVAFRHDGFWQPMDTLQEKRLLNELWRSGGAPWKIW